MHQTTKSGMIISHHQQIQKQIFAVSQKNTPLPCVAHIVHVSHWWCLCMLKDKLRSEAQKMAFIVLPFARLSGILFSRVPLYPFPEIDNQSLLNRSLV